MRDDEMRVQLQLRPVSASFPPKTFSLRPTVKVRIDLVGSTRTANPVSRPDNGVFPSPALGRYPAHIISHGSFFLLNTSVPGSNNIRVNGYLLEDHPHTLRDGDRIEFGKASCVGYGDEYDSDGDCQSWTAYNFAADLSIQVHLTFPPRFDRRRAWTDVFATPELYVPPSSIPPPSRSPPPSLPTTPAHPRPAPALRAKLTPAAGPAAPIGTDWDGIAKLLEELQAHTPMAKASHPLSFHAPVTAVPRSAQTTVAPSSLRSSLGDIALPTFSYGAFVALKLSALPVTTVPADVLTSLPTSCPPSSSIATSSTPEDSSAAAGSSVLASSGSSSTSVLTSVPGSYCHESTPARDILASPDAAVINDSPTPPQTTIASDITAVTAPPLPERIFTACLAVDRVRHAWVHARRVSADLGLATAKLAVDRTRFAWLQARGAIASPVSSLASPVYAGDSHAFSSQRDNVCDSGSANVDLQQSAFLSKIAPTSPLFYLPAHSHQFHCITAFATSVAERLFDLIVRLPSQVSLPHVSPFPKLPQPHFPSYQIHPPLPVLAPIHFR